MMKKQKFWKTRLPMITGEKVRPAKQGFLAAAVRNLFTHLTKVKHPNPKSVKVLKIAKRLPEWGTNFFETFIFPMYTSIYCLFCSIDAGVFVIQL